MASSIAQAWLARKVDLDPAEFTPEVENILVNCLSNGSHPSILVRQLYYQNKYLKKITKIKLLLYYFWCLVIVFKRTY